MVAVPVVVTAPFIAVAAMLAAAAVAEVAAVAAAVVAGDKLIPIEATCLFIPPQKKQGVHMQEEPLGGGGVPVVASLQH